MLPLIYRLRFDTDGSRPLLYGLVLALIAYSAWSGWRNADAVDDKGKLVPATPDERRNRAILYGVLGVALAAVGVFYATSLTVPFLGKGKGEGIPVHTYGIMLGAGFLSAVTVAALLARREWPGELGLKRRDQIMDLAFSVFIGGIVGSRELFVLVNWKDYVSRKPAEAYGTVLDLVAVVVLTGLVAFRGRLSKELAAKVVENAGQWFVYVLVGGRVALTVLVGGGGASSLTDMLGGGLVFQGGLIGATLASVWYCIKNDIEFLRLADLAAPTVSLGSAFGRLGCFAAGCCWGKPAGPDAIASVKFPGSHSTQTLFGTTSDTASLAWSSMSTDSRYFVEKTGEVFQQMVPDAVQVSQYAREHDHTFPIHPTQLYDSFAQLAFFALMLTVRRWRRFHGQIFGLWLMGYSIIRSTVELWRGDSERGTLYGKLVELGFTGLAKSLDPQAWYNISTGQTVSILLFGLGAYLVGAGLQRRAQAPKVDLAALTAVGG
ncbi:MAG: prolipoprotein diacylglyceryl transferase [Myxococcaceae bacterium]|jgi:phosphatidylglycerol:prolipoprotein diacylglycerol transferase|nr:prolipoprotein diacylglyceryl transferase [Myxococcaceae bacterium]MCA3015719.1 prolipoprotein diacylglyceryl transferase [Myxococcaceae bacterium]